MGKFTTCIYEELEIEVVIEDYYPARRGKFSGPPEDCYPDEPAEVEFSLYFITYGKMKAPDGTEKIVKKLVPVPREIYDLLYDRAKEAALEEADSSESSALEDALERREEARLERLEERGY